jgi:glycosyltransferase involved in cell wall biosynthesis
MQSPAQLTDAEIPSLRGGAGNTAPRVLVNATTCTKGGALQMATMFLQQAIRAPAEFEWRFAVSDAVYRELTRFDVALPEMEIFDRSPARDRASRTRLVDIERQVGAEVVFTVAGPAYVRFRARHVVVCAEPWVTHAGLTAYRSLRFPDEWLRFNLLARYKRSWFKAASAWILQTETARQGLHRRLGVPLEQCFVIPATCDSQYHTHERSIAFPAADEPVRLLCFTAPYKHKNLKVIPAVAAELSRQLAGRKFVFVFTLPRDHAAWRSLVRDAEKLGVGNRLENVGPIPVAEGPKLYESCHVCFLPTVLESFSATYPEAMAMGMPIVTSDLDFARDICRDAALSFPPRDARAGASQLVGLLNNRGKWDELVAAGKARIAELPTPEEQYQMDLAVFRQGLAVDQ